MVLCSSCSDSDSFWGSDAGSATDSACGSVAGSLTGVSSRESALLQFVAEVVVVSSSGPWSLPLRLCWRSFSMTDIVHVNVACSTIQRTCFKFEKYLFTRQLNKR